MTLTLVRAAGSPRDLGRAQGEGSAPGIEAALGFYATIDGYHEALTKTGPYIDAARAGAPDLVEEMEGLAEGAGCSFEAIALLNCLEEVFDFESCVTVVSGRFLLHAEQWYAGHDALVLVVAEPDHGPPFVSPTCAGFLPAVGLSAAGFAQGIDSLTASDDRVGIPRVLVSRRALGASSLEAAIGAAQMEGRAGGYAHVFATAGRTCTVETTALKGELIDGIGVHTNHCLGTSTAALSRPGSEGSIARYLRALELLNAGAPRSLSECARLLSDHDSEPQQICLHDDSPRGTATVFGMICDLEEGTVAVSDGPPCQGRWSEVDVPGFVNVEAGRVG
jgi:isopenicillin-N N-acyltransferase-like protein